jgi:hypothetical protein
MFGNEFDITQGTYGPRLTLHSAWSPGAAKAVAKRGVAELELNYAKGWRSGCDLSFLRDVPDLLALVVIDREIRNVSDVHVLKQLRALDINTMCDSEIDFSSFAQLDDVSLEWRPMARSLFGCVTLRRVFINNGDFGSLDVFRRLNRLEHLSLKSPAIREIGDASSLKRLVFLGIYNARFLTSLHGIEVLTHLERLEVERCRAIVDIEPVRGLRHLKKLYIPNNGDIASLAPVGDLMELEACHFHESTNIVDGDLAILKTLPRLRNTTFQQRRHYNCRRPDLPPFPD